MILRLALHGAMALAVCAASTASAEMVQQATPQAGQQPTQGDHPATASVPTGGESSGAAPLRVMVGKSLLINTSERLKRVRC